MLDWLLSHPSELGTGPGTGSSAGSVTRITGSGKVTVTSADPQLSEAEGGLKRQTEAEQASGAKKKRGPRRPNSPVPELTPATAEEAEDAFWVVLPQETMQEAVASREAQAQEERAQDHWQQQQLKHCKAMQQLSLVCVCARACVCLCACVCSCMCVRLSVCVCARDDVVAPQASCCSFWHLLLIWPSLRAGPLHIRERRTHGVHGAMRSAHGFLRAILWTHYFFIQLLRDVNTTLPQAQIELMGGQRDRKFAITHLLRQGEAHLETVAPDDDGSCAMGHRPGA